MSAEIKSIRIKFTKYVHETDRAYLVKYLGKEIWLPKKLCRNFAVHGNDMHGVVSIPAFLYERITGETVTEEFKDMHAETDWVITKHKPEKIAPVESKPHDEAFR